MQYNKISGFADEIDMNTDIQFAVFNKLGIEYFEPRGIDGKNICELNDQEVEKLKEKMDKHGIKASSIGSPVGKVKLSDEFEKHFDTYKRAVRTAKMLDTKYIRMFSFYHDGDGDWSDDERKEVFLRLGRMIEYARENDIILLHENEKDIYGDTLERCLDLMKNLYCENFKAVFDPANFVQCGVDTKKAFDMMKNYIEYMHIKDALAKDGTVVPAGQGDGNLEYIISQLFGTGYKGFLSLEPHLGSFEGLANLELDDSILSLPKGGEGTFTLAFNELNKIVKKYI